MTFIVMALYTEASVLIEHLALEKIEQRPFTIYKNHHTLLIISGIGNLQAAIATTYLLTKYQIKPSDTVVNIGICGSYRKEDSIGSLFSIKKIIDAQTSKIYPLKKLQNRFSAATITSFNTPQDRKRGKFHLVDMESMGFYTASKKFANIERIELLKIVHDHLEIQLPQKEAVANLIERNLSKISPWLLTL